MVYCFGKRVRDVAEFRGISSWGKFTNRNVFNTCSIRFTSGGVHAVGYRRCCAIAAISLKTCCCRITDVDSFCIGLGDKTPLCINTERGGATQRVGGSVMTVLSVFIARFLLLKLTNYETQISKYCWLSILNNTRLEPLPFRTVCKPENCGNNIFMRLPLLPRERGDDALGFPIGFFDKELFY